MKRNEKVEDILERTWRTFGQWMANRRQDIGWTQTELGEKLDMSPQRVSRIENGSPTKRATVLRIAEALKVAPGEALKKAGFDSTISADSVALPEDDPAVLFFQEYGQLNKKDKEELRVVFEMARERIRQKLRERGKK